jgi:hypothetical protein
VSRRRCPPRRDGAGAPAWSHRRPAEGAVGGWRRPSSPGAGASGGAGALGRRREAPPAAGGSISPIREERWPRRGRPRRPRRPRHHGRPAPLVLGGAVCGLAVPSRAGGRAPRPRCSQRQRLSAGRNPVLGFLPTPALAVERRTTVPRAAATTTVAASGSRHRRRRRPGPSHHRWRRTSRCLAASGLLTGDRARRRGARRRRVALWHPPQQIRSAHGANAPRRSDRRGGIVPRPGTTPLNDSRAAAVAGERGDQCDRQDLNSGSRPDI